MGLELGRVNHLVEGVVQGAEIGVDLRHNVTGQEPERLSSLDCRPREYDPGHLAPVEGLDRKRDGEVGLARPRWPDPEDYLMLAYGVGIGFLVAVFGATLRPRCVRITSPSTSLPP